MVNKGIGNRLYISVKFFDRDIMVLLDCGANISVIGSKALESLQLFSLGVNSADL